MSEVVTIPRSHKLRILRLKKELTTARVYSLSNDFTGRSVDIAVVWEQYDTGHGILRRSRDRYHIDVNQNLWYELK